MRPDVESPARVLARRECFMHEFMVEAVARGDLGAARACRAELAGVSERRARVAALEAEGRP